MCLILCCVERFEKVNLDQAKFEKKIFKIARLFEMVISIIEITFGPDRDTYTKMFRIYNSQHDWCVTRILITNKLLGRNIT